MEGNRQESRTPIDVQAEARIEQTWETMMDHLDNILQDHGIHVPDQNKRDLIRAFQERKITTMSQAKDEQDMKNIFQATLQSLAPEFQERRDNQYVTDEVEEPRKAA